MNRILKLDSGIIISNSRKIVDVRNRIIHGYDSVSDDVIWGIIGKNRPVIKKNMSVSYSMNNSYSASISRFLQSERHGFHIRLEVNFSPLYPIKKTPNFHLRFFAERKTRLELATTSLEGWSSTN